LSLEGGNLVLKFLHPFLQELNALLLGVNDRQQSIHETRSLATRDGRKIDFHTVQKRKLTLQQLRLFRQLLRTYLVARQAQGDGCAG
jgi:hypothetical protein